jgi:hypothetical protein
MYKQFFRLKENPFKLAPDPAYLCGRRQSTTGFPVGIYKEKGGVGKTLICAAFIAGLSEATKVAYLWLFLK